MFLVLISLVWDETHGVMHYQMNASEMRLLNACQQHYQSGRSLDHIKKLVMD